MAITAGDNLNSVATSTQMTLVNNYIDFTASGTAGWAQQYLPDLMEKKQRYLVLGLYLDFFHKLELKNL